MVVRLASVVVQGVGGSGRSTALADWVDEVERSRRVRPRLIEAAVVPPDADELVAWHLDADPDLALAVDDAEQLDEATLATVSTIAADRVVGLSLAPWPRSAALGRLVDRLVDGTAAADPAEIRRLESLGVDEIAELLPTPPVDGRADAVARQTAGNRSLVVAAARAGWAGDPDEIPGALADAVLRRLERLSGPAIDAIRLAAHGPSLVSVIGLQERAPGAERTSHLDRELDASGLVEGSTVVPLVASVAADDTTEGELARLADVALSTSNGDPVVGGGLRASDLARLHLAASSTTPVDRAAAALRLGRVDASSLVAELPDLAEPDAAIVAFADDVRQLRLDRAADRRLGGGIGEALTSLALTLTGHPTDAATSTVVDVGGSPTLWAAVDGALRAFLAGEPDDARGRALRVHDDAVRSRDETLAGITPSAVVALLLLHTGDAALAVDVMADATRIDAGGPGERRTHALIGGLAAMQLGDYSVALDLTREGDRRSAVDESGRDALLRAALDAAVARRSGDTARLRTAWYAARPLLERSLETWLLADQLTDLAATGARIGDLDTAQRVVDRLRDRVAGLPDRGPAPVIGGWAALQLDIAAESWDAVAASDFVWDERIDTDPRAQARTLARSAWRHVALARAGGPSAPVDEIRAAASALVEVGDAWDASRLLGQAALDDDDPQQARELLETARTLVTEPVESGDRLVAAGLSEREAEVSRLVVEGHTYKEIGAQLYISPKTVEHHVARIRQRLGAGSRAELLAMVRELLGA